VDKERAVACWCLVTYAKVQYLYHTSIGTSPKGDASVYDKTGIILLVSNPALCENISGYLNKDFVRE